MEQKQWVVWFLVCVSATVLLLSMASQNHLNTTPVPKRIVTETGNVIFTPKDIEQGQLVWRTRGAPRMGSTCVLGYLLAPDWQVEDWRREALALLQALSHEHYGVDYAQLDGIH